MFYCDPCRKKKGWPESFSKSVGPCEVCKRSRECNDVHHSMLGSTPELDKLHKVAPQSQKIGEFLDWLSDTKGLRVCKLHEHDDTCYGDNSRYPECQMENDTYYPAHHSTEKLLAEFFNIDMNKVEDERRKILEQLRASQK